VTPIPKDELASPHQLRSISCSLVKGTWVGACSRMKDISFKLALTCGGGDLRALNEMNDDAKYESERRKGQINGKIHEI
jgi:hypothetical protein